MALGIGFGVNWGSISLGPGNGGTPIDERFIFTVKTDNAGTSASNQFTIPTSTTGITQAFLYDIETSDGQTITGVTGNHTITFPSAGTYDIYISGSFPYMYFNNGGDKLKLLDIKNFGIYALGSTNQERAFIGCSNMTITATDVGNFGSVINLFSTWESCQSITSFPLIDTSNVTNFRRAWNNCDGLISFPLLDTSSGTNFNSTWALSNLLESIPALDLSNSETFTFAWFGCNSLTDFPNNMFNTAPATDYTNAFAGTNLTTQSIDDILISIDTAGQSNGTFTQSGGQAPSATGEAAIDSLVGKGWTITVTGGYAGLGAELVTNGTFDTNLSGWIIFDAGVAVWTSDYGGSMKITRGTTLARVGQEIIENTKNYRLTFDVKETNGCSQISVYNGSFYSVVSGIEVGSFQYDFTAGGTFFILAPGPLNIDVTIDNISIKEKL